MENIEKRREESGKPGTSHGMSKTKIWYTWMNMKARCYNKNRHDYHQYGGRGIKVCQSWLESFLNFYNDMGNIPDNHSLDRINNEKNYSKENCRWASKKEQSENRRPLTRREDFPTGVFRTPSKKNPFSSTIKIEGRDYYLGSFKSIEMAHNAYIKICKEWYGYIPKYVKRI